MKLIMKIQIINSSNHPLPEHQTDGSAGVDLHANIDKSITFKHGERELVGSGIHIKLPRGYEAQIRPRSGLALKHGVTIPNSPATIDSDYRGELKVILMNLGNEDFTLEPGDRMAQLVIAKHETAEWNEVESFDDEDTARDQGSFGSTGR